MKVKRGQLAAIAVVTLTIASAACSSSPAGSSGGTPLMQALARVADTAGARSQVSYDNTAALVRVAGANPGSRSGFAGLRGLGAPAAAGQIAGAAGLSLFGESYSITAGKPPQTLSLLAGGQSASRITARLTSLGWKRSGGDLIGPAPASASPASTALAEEMPQVLPAGPDVIVGGPGASLGQIGSPRGSTLAGDPAVSALAQCLGNVVAAEIVTGGYPGGRQPGGVAAGISQPASSTATPRAVICASWPSQAAAAGYAAALRQALPGGTSLARNVPYAKFLIRPAVTTVGGTHHLVRWQASTPGNALTVFQLLADVDLPALPDCGRLPAGTAAHVPGCP